MAIFSFYLIFLKSIFSLNNLPEVVNFCWVPFTVPILVRWSKIVYHSSTKVKVNYIPLNLLNKGLLPWKWNLNLTTMLFLLVALPIFAPIYLISALFYSWAILGYNSSVWMMNKVLLEDEDKSSNL